MATIDSSDPFENFLLKEYENIATAHFASQKQFALFLDTTLFFSRSQLLSIFMMKTEFRFKMTGLVVDFFSGNRGLFFWYAVNLKHEAVLYAQTVNGIRNHFYKPLSPESQKQLRTLPLDIRKPSFYSPDNPVLWIIT